MRFIFGLIIVAFTALFIIPQTQSSTLSFANMLSAGYEEGSFRQQVECMATNIYHEARQESELGQRAVAFVVLNRVNSDHFPSTACDVIYQAETVPHWKTQLPIPKRNRCQFSWYCDGKSDKINDKASYLKAERIAYEIMETYGAVYDPTEGSTYYHATYVKPNWRHLDRVVRIDSHIFYKEK